MKQDRDIHVKGLEQLGVEEKTIKKLQTLDGLAKSMGKFVSISLQTSFQMHAIQQIHLFEETERIREAMQSSTLPPSERVIYIRLYLDMVRETNRGHQQMFGSAEAMVSMIMAGKGRPANNGPTLEGKKKKRQRVGFHETVVTPA